MFNDERINFEMAKLKKLIIILSGVLGTVFLGYKLWCNSISSLSFYLYSTEIVIILTSLVILIGSLFIRSEIKDELYYERKAKYYSKSFIVFLYIIFIKFALVMPATITDKDNSILSSNICLNMIMMSSLFLGYGYLRFKRIYFNYNIIESNAKAYYKNVLKNILKIFIFFSIIYGTSLVVSLFYMLKYNPITIIISIFLAFLISFFTNSIYYLFISVLERIFYKEENKKRITTPTIILISLTMLFLLVSVLTNYIYYLAATGEIPHSSVVELTKLIEVPLSISNNFLELSRFFSVLGVTFLISDIIKNNPRLSNKLKVFIIAFAIFIVFEIIFAKIQPIINIFLYDLFKLSSPNNFELELEFFNMIENINLVVFSLKVIFYVTTSIILLITLKKELNKIKGLKFILILWIIFYLVELIMYLLQMTNEFYLFKIVGSIILIILTAIYLVNKYLTKLNKLEVIE